MTISVRVLGAKQQAEEQRLDAAIEENLLKLGVGVRSKG